METTRGDEQTLSQCHDEANSPPSSPRRLPSRGSSEADSSNEADMEMDSHILNNNNNNVPISREKSHMRVPGTTGWKELSLSVYNAAATENFFGTSKISVVIVNILIPWHMDLWYTDITLYIYARKHACTCNDVNLKATGAADRATWTIRYQVSFFH